VAAFDEVAQHDIEWGSEAVDWLAGGQANEHKQGYVSSLTQYFQSSPHARSQSTRGDEVYLTIVFHLA
jgi:hypothetical protein